jgi:hypothetical protein
VREIQAMNKKGIKVDKLLVPDESWVSAPVSEDLLKNNSLTRFDTAPAKNQQHRHPHKRKNRRFNDRKNK